MRPLKQVYAHLSIDNITVCIQLFKKYIWILDAYERIQFLRSAIVIYLLRRHST